MNIPDYYVEPASWTLDQKEIKAVRTRVFIVEQSVPEEEEWDEDDTTATHFLARVDASQCIGTARLTADGRIGRMAVVDDWRGQGVGDALLRACVEFARARNQTRLRLAAQTYALDFYAKQGFVATGDVFDDVGIPHQWMELELETAEAASDTVTMNRRATDRPPEQTQQTDTAAEFRQLLAQLLGSCRRTVLIMTQNLDPRLLDDDRILQQIRRIASSGTRPDIRIIVHDSHRAVFDGHRLILLGQRLSSLIQFRKPSREHQDYYSAYILLDDNVEIFREFGDRHEATFRINQRRLVRDRRREFDAVWQMAEPDPDLQQLDIS